ncbi:hypothetical protein BCF58_0882 [Chryseobacterium defluvii]|uniref:Uncharacterized protein n=1 Tax=Chryseobacterium defluvii TaxID=160396 RepID=A0A495SMX1_9FLAO|nr:hypothetical protein BCF58_0882 [Chryseobacterium defluvii]
MAEVHQNAQKIKFPAIIHLKMAIQVIGDVFR